MATTLRLRHLASVLAVISGSVLFALAIFVPGPAPASANPLTEVSVVSAGAFHSCAVTGTGNAKCWGENGFTGLLGNGTTADSLTPVDVIGLTTGTASIAVGERSTCALTAAGGVKCWGENGEGQLGDGTIVDRLAPVDVVGLTSGAVMVDVGTAHACAITLGGVKCWGRTFGTSPVDAPALTAAATGISAGGDHTCAVTTGAPWNAGAATALAS